MNTTEEEKFIRKVEDLVDPGEASLLFFFQSFRKLLPPSLFRKILHRTSRRFPRIGFVIEPYSLFLFFPVKDAGKAQALLPERYLLKKSAIFQGDEPDYYQGYGILNTRATTFGGTRVESYLIAEDRETGLMSWIFIDILSDTLIALPRTGIGDPNCSRAIFTTSSRGSILVDVEERKTGRNLRVKGHINNGRFRPLDEPLWLLGNTSIAHSSDLSDGNDDPFAVIFDPAEVEKALEIPLDDIEVVKNNLFPELAEDRPAIALCFPFAQHYIADSPGCRTVVRDRDDMISRYNKLAEGESLISFSAKGIRKLFLWGITLTAAALVLSLLWR